MLAVRSLLIEHLLASSSFEKSRTSVITPNRASLALRMRHVDALRSVSSVRLSSSPSPMTPFSGVRISWLMFATNSTLGARTRAPARWRPASLLHSLAIRDVDELRDRFRDHLAHVRWRR